MAARPYFTGNYGSSLARVDTSPIIEAGRAQGQMYANLGGQIGGMIKEYGLNKQKKEKATREVEGSIRMDPTLVGRLTGTGDEAWDKKQNTAIEKLTSGDLNLRGIEGLAGDIARLEKQDAKELAEANAQRQIALDLLKREQIGLDMKVKNQALKDAQTLAKVKVTEGEREQNALNQYSSQIQDIVKEVTSGTKPEDLSSQDQWLYVNRVSILNGQIPAGGMVVPRNFRATASQIEQSLEKGEQDIKGGKVDFKIKKVELGDKKTATASLTKAEEQKQQMYEWGDSRIHTILANALTDPNFDPAKLDIRDQKLFVNYQMWKTRNYPLSEFIGKPGDKVNLDALRLGYEQAQQDYETGEYGLISAEQKVELGERELAESDRIPLFKDNAAVLKYKASLPVGASAKFSKKGTGFDLESITLTAKAEEQMTPVDGMPGHFLYGGGLYKAEEVRGKKTLTKVTAQSFGQDVEMLERGIKILQTAELTAYEKGKSLAYDRDDDGNYIYSDSQGDDVEVPFSHEYEEQLHQLNLMKAKYKKALGDNLIDLRSR